MGSTNYDESTSLKDEKYVVPTGRVNIPAGRYVVPTGKDNVIVSAGRTKVIPAGRTILVLKEEYDTWAMKMEYWIINSDHNLWNIVLNGNSRKRIERDPKGNIMILPPISVEEHIAVQRETKARTILLQSLSEDHMVDFHHLDDARDIWLAVKARFRAITLKTKGGLDYLSFDDLYNKLRTLEIDVKGGSSYDSRSTSAPTHSAFISATSTNSKMSYPDQSHSTTFTTVSSSPAVTSNVIETVLHSFVAKSDPQQKIIYEDFDQIGKLDLEELDIKWQMVMLSVRINRFEKKTKRKMKFNNKDAVRFDKKKVKCYKCSELGYFARECTGKQLDSKARYSAFKLKELDKSEEPKALLSVDSMMIVEAEDDDAGDVTNVVPNAATEFALMGISSQDLETLLDQMRFVKAVGMHAVPPPLTGTFMPPSNRPDLDDTQFTYGSKFNNHLENNSVSNDFVSCDDSDKSSDLETTGFASCVSSVKSSSSKSNEPLVSAPSSVDFKTVSETPAHQPSSTNDDSSFSFKENVKCPRNLCNKSGIKSRSLCKRKSFGSKTCFVYGSKFHLIKDCDFYEQQLGLSKKPMWHNVANIPLFVPRPAYVPAGSRNSPASVSAGSAFPGGSRNLPASVSAGSAFPAGSRNSPASVSAGSAFLAGCRNRPASFPAGRPFSTNEGRWGTAVKPSAGCSWRIQRPNIQWGSKNNGGSHQSTWFNSSMIHKAGPNSGCSRSLTGNKEKLDDYVKTIRGTVTFGGGNGKITGKGTIRTSKLNFENEFQLPEDSQVLLRVPRRNNLYCFNLSNIQPERDVTCLLVKASLDESTKWHRRMAHVNFKNMNKLAKLGLVNGLPSKLFTNEHNCVACNKGKQHKATYKAITAVSTISAPLQLLHMDLFGPTSIRSIDHKYYSLVGIKRDYSNARTPQQNGVTKRKNRTLIEAARTMLADSTFPTMFGQKLKVPNISHLKPFGFHVTILNTSDHLGKFEGKADEGFIVRYAAHSKAYWVYNLSSKKIEETLNLRYLKDKPNVQGLGQEWYFDLDYLTDSLGYTCFKSNQPAGIQAPQIHAGTKVHEASDMVESNSDYAEELARLQRQEYEAKDTAAKYGFGFSKDTAGSVNPAASISAGSIDPAASIFAGSIVHAASISIDTPEPFPTIVEPVHVDATSLPPGHSLGSSEHSTRFPSPSDLANSISSSSKIEDLYHHPSTSIFSSSSYDADFGGTVTNLVPIVDVDPVPTKCVNTIHPQSQILGDLTSLVQTRGTLKNVAQVLNDSNWVEAMQEEMQQFINQMVWKLVPLPEGKIAIGIKWILKNKKDARGIVVRNKARLVAQGHRQEEGIDYDEVFAPVARIKTIRLFLAFASYMGFMVYQMDVKSAFLYGEIDEEVYVTQPKGFEDPHFPKHVYKVVKALYGLHQAPRAWSMWMTLFLGLQRRPGVMKGEFEISAMGELTFFLGLQVKQKTDGIFISQDKYVQDMLKKFDMESVRTATTPYEASKLKSKDEPDDDVNVRLYRSMIVKKIFKYLKGQLKLGLWCPRDSPFVLEAYSDSDYAGSHGDRKPTTGGCQFLGRRLISWQCKKQTIVATYSTEAKYVAAANCCGQFWSTASLKAYAEGPLAILATIDWTSYTITESLLRSQLQLDDDGGVEDLPIADIYLGKATGIGIFNTVRDVKANLPRVIRYYKLKGEGRIAKQCNAKKRFNTTSIFKANHVDAFDSDCGEAPTASEIFMAKLSPARSVNADDVGPSYDSDILSEVPSYDPCHDNDMLNPIVQEMKHSEQLVFVNDSHIELTSDINVISYSQYLTTNENEVVQSATYSEQH
ncbi:putative ribonuclease H-like domain-containing protein [Tanacetum coccineum]